MGVTEFLAKKPGHWLPGIMASSGTVTQALSTAAPWEPGCLLFPQRHSVSPRASVLTSALQEALLTSALGVLVSGQVVRDKKGQWEAGRPLPAASQGFSLAAVGRLLTVGASFIASTGCRVLRFGSCIY